MPSVQRGENVFPIPSRIVFIIVEKVIKTTAGDMILISIVPNAISLFGKTIAK